MRVPRSRLADRASRGQSLVEFALVFPVLILMIAGIVQLGVLFWGQNTLNQVVRDTGRWAASQQDCSNQATVLSTAKSIAANSSLIGDSSTWSSPANVSATWTGSPCPPLSNQDTAWVTITIHHRVPIFFPWLPISGDLTSVTQFRMEPMPK